jgi:hypothetical protein
MHYPNEGNVDVNDRIRYLYFVIGVLHKTKIIQQVYF